MTAEVRTERVVVYLSNGERERLRAIARNEGIGIGALVRRLVLEALEDGNGKHVR